MSITSDQFRNTMRYFPAGVTVVTIKVGEEVHGLTVSAFASVSPEPPLILVIIDQRHRAYEMMEQQDAVFAVNILHEEQEDLSDRFAWTQEDRFGLGDWSTAVTGAPILTNALAWLDCSIYGRHAAGNHTIFVGEVQDTFVSPAVVDTGRPLVYWNREYRKIRD